MGDGRFPFEVVNGVPVVTAPEEIDITNAPELRSALLEAAAHGHGTLVADLTGPGSAIVRAAYAAGGAQARPGRRRRTAAGYRRRARPPRPRDLG